jgi:hypothetical protein
MPEWIAGTNTPNFVSGLLGNTSSVLEKKNFTLQADARCHRGEGPGSFGVIGSASEQKQLLVEFKFELNPFVIAGSINR